MFTHCCVGYLTLTNVQNAHNQPQCIVYNKVQQWHTFRIVAGGIAARPRCFMQNRAI
jgi:hypothetical protein